MPGLCIVCTEEESTGRMRTCVNCRASMHRWEKREAGDIVARFANLRKWSKRMTQFSVVRDDDKVEMVDHKILQQRRIMEFRDVTRRAKANVVQMKLHQRRVKQARSPPPRSKTA